MKNKAMNLLSKKTAPVAAAAVTPDTANDARIAEVLQAQEIAAPDTTVNDAAIAQELQTQELTSFDQQVAQVEAAYQTIFGTMNPSLVSRNNLPGYYNGAYSEAACDAFGLAQ